MIAKSEEIARIAAFSAHASNFRFLIVPRERAKGGRAARAASGFIDHVLLLSYENNSVWRIQSIDRPFESIPIVRLPFRSDSI